MTYTLYTLPACCRCPAVKNYLETTSLKGKVLDAVQNMDDCRRLNINSTPTVVFYGNDGFNEIGREFDITGVKKFIQNHS